MVDMDIATIVAEAVHLVPELKVIWMQPGVDFRDATSTLDPRARYDDLDNTWDYWLTGKSIFGVERHKLAGCPCIYAAEPKDMQTLFVFLHEMGHLVLKQWGGFSLQSHSEREKDASCWAKGFLAKRGVILPDEVWDLARENGHFNSDCGQQE